MPAPIRGDGADDGPAIEWLGEAEHGLEFALHAFRAGLVGFIDDEDVGDFHDAGFDGLHIVAHAGTRTTTVTCATAAISISSWPTPTVSMRT